MEQIFETIGYKGPFQKYVFFINIFLNFLPIIYTLQIPFLTKYPSFFVKEKRTSIVYEREFTEDLCNSNLYSLTKNPQKSIINWSYTFDLYCERDKYNILITTFVFIFNMIGAIIVTLLPDIYGRRKSLILIAFTSFFLHLNLFFALGPVHLLIINSIGGFFCICYSLGFTIFTEFYEKNENGVLIGIYNAVYPFNGILYAIFFLISNNWRLLFLFFSLLHIPFCYLVLKYFVESPRWFISIGQREKCLSAIEKIAQINNNTDKWDSFQKSHEEVINSLSTVVSLNPQKNEQNSEGMFYLFTLLHYPSIRKTFIKLTLCGIGVSYNYYGIVLNLGKMQGNFYLNSIFAFLGEIIAETTTGKLADIFGRVTIISYSSFLGSVCFFLYMVAPYEMKFVFVMTAMIGFSGAFNVISIYTPEIYPTKCRTMLYGTSNFIGRVGPLAIPTLTKILGEKVNYTFLISGLFMGIISMTFEETLGKPIIDYIPEEIKEKENIKQKFLYEQY